MTSIPTQEKEDEGFGRVSCVPDRVYKECDSHHRTTFPIPIPHHHQQPTMSGLRIVRRIGQPFDVEAYFVLYSFRRRKSMALLRK